MILQVPASKSLTIRALLLAALANGNSQLNNMLISEDTLVLIEALRQLGVKIAVDQEKNQAIIQGCSGQFSVRDAAIDCCNSGLTARFLLAVCATQPGTYHFDGITRMYKRPIKSLIDVLSRQGCEFYPEDAQAFPLTITVPQMFLGGEIEVDSAQSSQFASALLMIAPFAKNPTTLQIKNTVSRPYIDMSIKLMRQFGVDVERKSANELVIANQRHYQACDYLIEPDCSTASYFFAAAALMRREITIENINRAYCLQGDTAFLTVLEDMGCVVEQVAQDIKLIGPEQLQGVDVNMNAFSDTFMTLAAIAPFANSPTTITNIAHTRLKESDRIHAMATELSKLNIKVEVGESWLRIYPSRPIATAVDSHNDHRIVMSLAILGLKIPGIKIQNKECVKKTCPTFFDLYARVAESCCQDSALNV